MPLSEFFPPSPKFTEANIPDQTGKVFIVTGGSVGVGLEVTKILYQKNGTVYIATRSIDKIKHAISTVRQEFPASRGRLEPLVLDLSDLSKIKRSAEDFLSKESRLDVLFNNAGVMNTPVTSTSAQGHELQMATNCLGPYLFTTLLEPALVRTSRVSARPGKVRIVYLASMISVGAPKGGIPWDAEADKPKLLGATFENYMESKIGSVFLAHDAAKRLGRDGVVAVSVNPGLMKTELQRNSPAVMGTLMGVVFKPAKYGAYSELFAALSPDVSPENGGAYIVPWGRFGEIPGHIAAGMKSRAAGGSGLAQRFISYCERETSVYR